ncbi:MAG: DDE-type integrase/transposase/recombinase [Bacteroidota bacterium]
MTYIPMRKDFMYLTAIMAVYSRKILALGIEQLAGSSRFVRVLPSTIAWYGKSEIINSDQGFQYTRALWTQFLSRKGIHYTTRQKPNNR